MDYKEKYLKLIDILKRNIKIDERYSSQSNGSTKAIKLLIEDCVSVEEDDEFVDDCYPNYDFDELLTMLEDE